MGNEKNMFGGGNARSLYTPMSDDEREVLSRLVAARDLNVHILGWGIVNSPKVSFGDLRLDIPIQITFNRPALPIPVYWFDLELRTGSGILLFGKREKAVQGDQPIMVGAGFTLQMVWHVAIRRMDPKLVKALKPGALGLTSRWTDKDTGEETFLGNTKMNTEKQQALRRLRRGEARVRAMDVADLAKASRKASGG